MTSRLESLESHVQKTNVQIDSLEEMRLDVKKLNANCEILINSVKDISKKQKIYPEILIKIDELSTFVTDQRSLKEDEHLMSLQSFVELYHLNLPMENIDNFNAFEIELKDINKLISSDLVS